MGYNGLAWDYIQRWSNTVLVDRLAIHEMERIRNELEIALGLQW